MNTMPTPTPVAKAALDAMQQRADQRVGWPAMSPEKAEALVDALNDRRHLLELALAVRDLAENYDEWEALQIDGQPAVRTEKIREAMTAALTPSRSGS